MSITAEKTYAKGLKLAEQGNHAESLVYMKRYLEEKPNDAEALSDTGAVLYCLGETDQAVEHFKMAVETDNKYGQSYWNLVEAYLRQDKIQKAVDLFSDMQRLGLLSADLTVRAANHFLEKSELGPAIEMMLKSIEISDCRELVDPMIDVVKSKRPKVAFFGVDENDEFFKSASERFMVVNFNSQKAEELADVINWCDIAWFDGSGDELARTLSFPKVCIVAVKSDALGEVTFNPEGVDRVVDSSKCDDVDSLNGVLVELENEMKAKR